MDQNALYENRPAPGAVSCVGAMFQTLRAAIETVPGQKVCIAGSHDRRGLTIWAQDA
jgi:hypothetical protein